jgi:hypothetical protein
MIYKPLVIQATSLRKAAYPILVLQFLARSKSGFIQLTKKIQNKYTGLMALQEQENLQLLILLRNTAVIKSF